MSLCCQQDDRRDAVRGAKGLNGLDYVEVSNDQLTLTAFFLGKLPPELALSEPKPQNTAMPDRKHSRRESVKRSMVLRNIFASKAACV